jgi:hypothetical protein
MQNMPRTNPDCTIRRILSAWSHTLELDQPSGESIVTQLDLSRLARVLSQHLDASQSSNLPGDANTCIPHTQILTTQILTTPILDTQQ